MTKLQQVEAREVSGKQVKTLRRLNQLPAVLYGPKFPSTNVVLDRKEFAKVFKKVGFSSMIDLTFNGEAEKVLIKEVQIHPVQDEILHAGLYVIDAASPITAEIPIKFTGVAPIEATGEGFVVYSLNSIAVRCLPKYLPSELTVDVSMLANASESLLVESVKLPENVELDSKEDPHAAIAYVAMAQKIEDVLAEIEAEHEAEGTTDEPEEVAEGAEGEAAEGEGEAGAEGETTEGAEEGTEAKEGKKAAE